MTLETLSRTGAYFVSCYVLFGYLASHIYGWVWLIQYIRFGRAIIRADTDWKAHYIRLGMYTVMVVAITFLWPVFLWQSRWEQLKASIPQKPVPREA